MIFPIGTKNETNSYLKYPLTKEILPYSYKANYDFWLQGRRISQMSDYVNGTKTKASMQRWHPSQTFKGKRTSKVVPF